MMVPVAIGTEEALDQEQILFRPNVVPESDNVEVPQPEFTQ